MINSTSINDRVLSIIHGPAIRDNAALQSGDGNIPGFAVLSYGKPGVVEEVGEGRVKNA